MNAPVCRKYMRAETKTPWYNNTILTAKRYKRQLERRWRRLQTDESRQAYRVQCIALNKLLYTTRVNYYSDKITAGGHNTKTLFKIAKELTGHNENPILPSHNDPNILANEFSEYFCDKVKKIRDGITIDLSKSPPSETRYSGDKLTTLQLLTLDEVKHLIESSPTKSCELDPIPTWLVKECMLELLPLITAIINNSITSGVYPCLYRKAIVRPLLKKTVLDPNEYKNYIPVSNLFFISKLIEKAVSLQLEHYLSQNNLLDIYQSGYRMYHSTETAILKITNDILINKNEQCSTALVAIDLSAAFDLVNHSILLERLYTYYGISGTALEWFRSYLSGRTQSVVINGIHSQEKMLDHGVPQGSVLGARLYTLYIRPLSHILSPSSMQIAINRLEDCLLDVSHWMAHNGLKLNNDKTEWLIFNGNPEISKGVTLTVGAETIKQSTSIRNLGVRLEPDLTMLPHINDTCRSGYYHLRRINKIRKYLSDCGTKTLIQALVISRMDYCNSIYNGLPIKSF